MVKLMQGKKTLNIIYFCTIITLCSLYAAQPIQPVFQREFELSRLQAALFTTFMMAPLGIAPLFYGFLLESMPPKRLVRGAVLGMAILEILFGLTSNYFILLTLRALQGLLIPAVLTSMMSYISFTSSVENVQHRIALYIASTIVGGFLGRLLSSVFTDLFGWRFFFFLLGALFFIAYWLMADLKKNVRIYSIKPSLSQMGHVVKKDQFFYLYSAIFCIFFVFSAMMNLVPFQLKILKPTGSELVIGFLYSGYAMGVLVATNTPRLIAFFGSELQAILAGITLFICGTLFFFTTSYTVMFSGMFVFCGGMFMAHSLLSGLVNKLADTNKGLVNGVYISCYYMGGTIGSFLPGAIFEYYGWNIFLFVLLAVQILSLILILAFMKRYP